jgi:hypothetical protein
VIWFGASESLLKPRYIASMVCPILTVSTGCCVPVGSWLSTELILVLISVSALSAS